MVANYFTFVIRKTDSTSALREVLKEKHYRRDIRTVSVKPFINIPVLLLYSIGMLEIIVYVYCVLPLRAILS